jgi:hypothetical protein
MGSYSNPEQVKDYSNEIVNAWSKAAESVTGNLIKYGEEKQAGYAAKVKEYNENSLAAKKLRQSYYGKLDALAEGYGGADFHATFDKYVDQYADISLRIANKTSENEAADLKTLAAIDNSINLTKSGIESLMSYQEKYKKANTLVGKPGGFDITQDISRVNAFGSLYGDIPADKTINIVEDPKTGNPVSVNFGFKGSLGGKEWNDSIDSVTLGKMNDFGISALPIIPDPDGDIGSALTQTDLYKKVSVTDKTGAVSAQVEGPSDSYYTQSDLVDSESVQGKVTVNKIGTLNKEMFAADLEKNEIFQTKVDGYIGTPGQASALMNNILREKGNNKIYTAQDFIENKDNIKSNFSKQLALYVAGTQKPIKQMTDSLGKPISEIRETTVRENVDFDIKIDKKAKGDWGPKEKQRQVLSKNRKSIITYYKDPNKQPKIESLP